MDRDVLSAASPHDPPRGSGIRRWILNVLVLIAVFAAVIVSAATSDRWAAFLGAPGDESRVLAPLGWALEGLLFALSLWALACVLKRRLRVALLVASVLIGPVVANVAAVMDGVPRARQYRLDQASIQAQEQAQQAGVTRSQEWTDALPLGPKPYWLPESAGSLSGVVQWKGHRYPRPGVLSEDAVPVFATARGVFVLSQSTGAFGLVDDAGVYTPIAWQDPATGTAVAGAVHLETLGAALSPDESMYAQELGPITAGPAMVIVRRTATDAVVAAVKASIGTESAGVTPRVMSWQGQTLVLRDGLDSSSGTPVRVWSQGGVSAPLVLAAPVSAAGSPATEPTGATESSDGRTEVVAASSGDRVLVLRCMAPGAYYVYRDPQYAGQESGEAYLGLSGAAVPCVGPGVVVSLKAPGAALRQAARVLGMSPDGRYLIVGDADVLDVDTGAVTHLTPRPPARATAGWATGFWHDARHVEILRGAQPLALCEIPAGPCTRS